MKLTVWATELRNAMAAARFSGGWVSVCCFELISTNGRAQDGVRELTDIHVSATIMDAKTDDRRNIIARYLGTVAVVDNTRMCARIVNTSG